MAQESADGIVGQDVGKASEALQRRKAEQRIGRAGNDGGAVAICVGIDWRGLRLDEDTWSSSKVNRLIGEFLSQGLPAINFAHGDLT